MSHSDERQEKAVGRYFEGVAKKWFDLAYDPGGNFSTFPTGKIRQDITIEEIRRLQAGRKVMDLGCGTGQLVIELLTKGYFALGIDGSRRMITIARSFLKKRLPNADGQQIFRIANVLDFVPEESFDVITAMGLLEYLTDDHAFFERIRVMLRRRGLAFVECRNRLFNVTSANLYTLEAAKSGDLNDLIRQLDGIGRYSPTKIGESFKIQETVFQKAAALLRREYSKGTPELKRMQFHGTRRQHTPEELERVLRRSRLKLKHVLYYHVHPYIPRYERDFPVAFNRVAVAMQPIGYTALGSTTCSAFVAVVEK